MGLVGETQARLLAHYAEERRFGILAPHRVQSGWGTGYVAQLSRSLKLLEDQWARGVLPGHRACSLKDKAKVERRWLAGNPVMRHEARGVTHNNYRCGSPTCRPGDPMGCAAANSRMKAKQSAFILDRWLDQEDARAFYGLFETRGGPGEELSSVLTRAAANFDRLKASDKGDWRRAGDAPAVGGYAWHLGAYRKQGRWIARRWVFIGTTGDGAPRTLQGWSRRISDAWKNQSATDGGSGAFSGWRRVRGAGQAEIIARVAAGVTRRELSTDSDVKVRRAARVIEAHDEGERAWLLEEASIDDPWYREYALAFERRPIWKASRAAKSHPEWSAAMSDPDFKRIRFSNSHIQQEPSKSAPRSVRGKRRPVEGD